MKPERSFLSDRREEKLLGMPGILLGIPPCPGHPSSVGRGLRCKILPFWGYQLQGSTHTELSGGSVVVTWV